METAREQVSARVGGRRIQTRSQGHADSAVASQCLQGTSPQHVDEGFAMFMAAMCSGRSYITTLSIASDDAKLQDELDHKRTKSRSNAKFAHGAPFFPDASLHVTSPPRKGVFFVHGCHLHALTYCASPQRPNASL